MKRSRGFTLIEVLLSVLILGLSSVGIFEVYTAGLKAMEVRVDEGQLDSALRSRMERVLATKVYALSSGSEVIAVDGDAYTMTWTVSSIDLNGDMIPDAGAKQVIVTLGDKSLTTIVVDNADRVGKI